MTFCEGAILRETLMAVILCNYTYDSQGRRFEKKVTSAGTVELHHRYIYRGYLQIAALDLTRSAHPALWFVTWDPSQPVATRPLAIQKDGTWFTYGYDLTKNICEVFGPAGYIRTSYSYAPFGSVSESGDVSQPLQWSSEHYDSELDLVYYNYRHYSPSLGRFLSRDPIEEQGGLNLYAFARNHPIVLSERLGLISFVDVALPVLEGALYAGEFCAGAADSFTFGATKYLRDLINEALTGTGDYEIQHENVYFAGEVVEISTEIIVTGGSAALKVAAKRAIEKESLKIIAKQGERALTEETSKRIVEKAKSRLANRLRREARTVIGASKDEVVHHTHSLLGHPPFKGRESVQSSFPTIGVRWIANNPKNLTLLKKSERRRHVLLHQRAYISERVVIGSTSPVLTAHRIELNRNETILKNSAVDFIVDVKNRCSK